MSGRPLEERLLVLLPTSKDAERTVAALSEGRIECVKCRSVAELCAELERGADAALLTEEMLLADREERLLKALRQEPSWSDFPLIVLIPQGRTAPREISAPVLNMTLVERPVRFLTLRSVVMAALRHRRHQYEVRDTLLSLTRQAEALRASETELKRARGDLERVNRELERRVEERTLRLQETVSELEAFSYSISHDLRAPLRTMQGYADLLLEMFGAKLGEEGQRYLGKIRSGAVRLDLLVQDVLAYSRIAKGQIELQNVSLKEVLQDVLETYPQFREKATITVEEPLPRVRAHPAYLTQCVSNLLGNAVKFVRPGVPPRVKIHSSRDGDPAHVRVWFEDNGIGIAPEHFKEIFEIFGRVHPGPQYEGTGIGLAIVRKAAERMGGTVGLTSELGKGTRFWLSLKEAV